MILDHIDFLDRPSPASTRRWPPASGPFGRDRVTQDDTGGRRGGRRGDRRRDRRRHVPLPERRPPRSLGRRGPGQPRVGRQAPPGGDPPRRELAQACPRRGGQGCWSHERYLPGAQYHRSRHAAGQQGHHRRRPLHLVAAWHMLSTGQIYEDLGADWFQRRRNPDAETRVFSRASKPSATTSPSPPPRASTGQAPKRGLRPRILTSPSAAATRSISTQSHL